MRQWPPGTALTEVVGAVVVRVAVGLEPGLVTVAGIEGVTALVGAALVGAAAGVVAGTDAAALAPALADGAPAVAEGAAAEAEALDPPVLMTVTDAPPADELWDEHAASVSAAPTARAAVVVRVMGSPRHGARSVARRLPGSRTYDADHAPSVAIARRGGWLRSSRAAA
ncbi:hypothetical protein acdb102_25850 [Acidothermaceae bacterium B102]|nr:hypothetical protein acdb102_25850 [Acidothermaceae bacterium B102]